MEYRLCSNCNFENDTAALYCQKCGAKLPVKQLKKFLNSLEFGSIAGAGQKGTSIAPLVGMTIDKNNSASTSTAIVRTRYTLEDGMWYCPYCGKKNRQTDIQCLACNKPRP